MLSIHPGRQGTIGWAVAEFVLRGRDYGAEVPSPAVIALS